MTWDSVLESINDSADDIKKVDIIEVDDSPEYIGRWPSADVTVRFTLGDHDPAQDLVCLLETWASKLRNIDRPTTEKEASELPGLSKAASDLETAHYL